MYAKVIIPLAVPKILTWKVPVEMQETITPGSRVEVGLGKTKKYAGIVKHISYSIPEYFEAREIINILDPEPVVNAMHLQLWEWIAAYYMCTEGEVMAAALPAHLKLSSETILVYNEEAGDDFSHLNNNEFVIAEALLIKKQLNLNEVQQLVEGTTSIYKIINALINYKIATVWEALRQGYVSKKETFVYLADAYNNDEALAGLLNNDKKLQQAEKQLALLLGYLHFKKIQGEVVKKDLLQKTGASAAQLNALVNKGILYLQKRDVDRLPQLSPKIDIQFTLSPIQQDAYNNIQQQLQEKEVCLLHGVTGSGKTEIYIQFLAECIRQGQQVLYMLPEIALTSQIIKRLQQHFGGNIGVYHSKFSQNERIEIWQKVKAGIIKVIVGARSALFLPFNNLSLIICDEEHDASFKQQERAPRYHARDAAIFFAAQNNAKVILGTATPSLETYLNAKTGKYGYVQVTERYGNAEIPVIEIVDTKLIAQPDKSKVMISPPVKAAIETVLMAGKQVIIFQNRRGYTPYQVCNTCNYIPQCRDCDVNLTFHKLHNKLQCHYCGKQYNSLVTCPACGSHHFIQRNFGTEKLEELLKELFPDANISRLDMDTARGKKAHEIIISQFEQQQVDILIGTQMVVKGFDFENVDLVVIPDADGVLNFADFRVHERAFQLLEQVSGRAGRKNAGGKVILQTAYTTHPVLHWVTHHQYEQMADTELAARKNYFYPPYSRIIHLTFKHKSKEVVAQAAAFFANIIHQQYGQYIVGPAEPPVARIRNQYLMEMMLKLPKDNRVLSICKKHLLDAVISLHQQKEFKSVVVIPDVDKM